ncbi:MAG: glycosyltransferase [Saprospiraceae bacterium]
MKRIICTVTNDLSHDQRMMRICDSLQKAGYSVLLVGRKRPSSPTLPPLSFATHRLSCWFQQGKLFYLEYNLRLLWFLLWQRFHLINAVDLDTLLPAYLVSRLKDRPCVYDAHEYFTEVPEVVRRPHVQRVWEGLARWLIPRLSLAYTVGPALARVLSDRYGIPFAVVRNVPYSKAPSASPPPAVGVLLYQGMLNEGRGLETALAALHLLPACRLILAGDGDIRDRLTKMAQDLGVSDRVDFKGFVPPSDLPALTATAWLGLNLLEQRSLSYYYSLANKAFDYISAGIPSVQMDFPEYRAIQEQYRPFLLLPELEATALASHIQQLIDTPATYQQLATNCRAAAKNLCWEQEEEHLLSFYRRVIPV